EGELSATAGRRQENAPKLIHSLRGDLDWIVMKCLEKNRARRYESATALVTDIQRHLNDEPITARPPSYPHRLYRALRRNKVAVTALAAVLAGLMMGLGLAAWLASR